MKKRLIITLITTIDMTSESIISVFTDLDYVISITKLIALISFVFFFIFLIICYSKDKTKDDVIKRFYSYRSIHHNVFYANGDYALEVELPNYFNKKEIKVLIDEKFVIKESENKYIVL